MKTFHKVLSSVAGSMLLVSGTGAALATWNRASHRPT